MLDKLFIMYTIPHMEESGLHTELNNMLSLFSDNVLYYYTIEKFFRPGIYPADSGEFINALVIKVDDAKVAETSLRLLLSMNVKIKSQRDRWIVGFEKVTSLSDKDRAEILFHLAAGLPSIEGDMRGGQDVFGETKRTSEISYTNE